MNFSDIAASAEQMPLVGRPPSRETKIAGAPDWKRAKVRRATGRDARQVAQWTLNTEEVKWLGATGGPKLSTAEVSGWITNSYGAFVLLYDDEPVAFANIAPLDKSNPLPEVGRLIVSPEHRRRGFGSTLTRHLAASCSSTLQEKAPALDGPFLRTAKDNEKAIRLVSGLPFSRTSSPLGVEDSIYLWHVYYLSVPAHRFGKELRRLREERGISQSYLAFLCGVQRTAINMVEVGRRNPSVQLLQHLCTLLAKDDQSAKSRLLLSCIGEQPEETIRSYREFDHKGPAENSDLWIISDHFAEFLSEDFLASSRHDLERGHMRWFFLSPGKWASEGEMLKSLICEGITPEPGALRFYEAPEVLCQMRIVVEGPGKFSAKQVTIEGEGKRRVPLADDRAEAFYLALRSTIFALEEYARRGRGRSLKEFTLYFPETVHE